MKKTYTLIIFIACVCFNTQAQNLVHSENIDIDFDKCIHIVLSSNIEYVESGSAFIEAIKIPDAPNVVKLTALVENFPSRTNVIVVTKNGHVFTYNVQYNVNKLQPCVFFPDSDKQESSFTAFLNQTNASHFIFPKEIVYHQSGNESNFKSTKTVAKNILKVEGLEINDDMYSNLFCIDTDGNDYNVLINVGHSPSYTYNISNDSNTDEYISSDNTPRAIVSLNEESLENVSANLHSKKREITTIGFKKNKYEFSLNNLYVDNKHMYFTFELQNKSNINLDIDFVKCFFVDEKKSKKSVEQEIVVEHKYAYNFEGKIEDKSSNRFILVFDKFTIPDKKVFKIEIYEKGGGRHINFKIKNNTIIDAKAIK